MRERLAVDGKAPLSVVVVSVTIGLHALRQGLHALGSLEAGDLAAIAPSLPTLGEILRDQVAYAATAEEGDRRLDEAYSQSMW